MNPIILRRLFLVLIMVLTFGAFEVSAEEEVKPSASADVGVFNKYMWRGFELSDESIVIQPSVTVEYKGFSVNLWGNLDTEFDDGDPTTNDQSEFNETDFTLAYDTSIGDFDLGIGYIYYALDGLNDPEEIYASVCASAIPLAPTLTVYRDLTEVIGWYMNLGISHSIELPREMTLDLGGSVGYYYSDDDAFVEMDKVGGTWVASTKKYQNLHDGQVSVCLTIPIDKYFTLTPMIAYSFPLGGDADDLLTSSSFSNDSDFFFGGVTLSIAF